MQAKTPYGEAIPPRLYHVSFNSGLAGKRFPKLPDGYTDGGQYVEPDIPRISTAPTYEGCFRAIYPNVSRYFEDDNYPYMVFTVYEVLRVDPVTVVGPQEAVQKRLVHDAHVTGEYYTTSPAVFRKVGQIKVLNTSDGKFLKYRPFGTEAEREHSPAVIKIKNA